MRWQVPVGRSRSRGFRESSQVGDAGYRSPIGCDESKSVRVTAALKPLPADARVRERATALIEIVHYVVTEFGICFFLISVCPPVFARDSIQNYPARRKTSCQPFRRSADRICYNVGRVATRSAGPAVKPT